MTYFNEFGQGRLGWRSPSSGGGGSTIDADAQAFITAANITDSTQQSAINTLVTQLKTYGIWTKMKALYPFVGGTASSHKFNLKDPRDVDAAYRLVFNGGWTHSATGALPNGTTAFADTKLNENTVLTLNNEHISYYSRTNSVGNFSEMGNINTFISGNPGINLNLKWSDGNFYPRVNDNNSGISNPSSSTGLFVSNRTNSTQVRAFQNGVLKLINSNSIQKVDLNIYIGATRHSLFGTSFYTNRESAFASIGDGLTDTEAAAFYNAVQTFQTTLGRQVGVPIVADSDAQAFLNAAVITDQTQANAVNTLVTSLKSANIWTKMKAIYPFVGGTATTHKFNLKDPRDLDVAYRLVFNGGWTHSSTGALPNGTTAYADTKLVPSTTLTQYNSHLSYYSRSQTLSSSNIEFGAYNTDTQCMFLTLQRSGGNGGAVQYSISADSNMALLFGNTTTTGMYLSNRTSSTATSLKYIRNGVSLANATTTAGSLPSIPLFLGGSNNLGSPLYYSSKETAFASIGDGLTDTEATAFYNAVQAYQTTLGRQI